MEIKNQNSETLKGQLKKTKLTMQILTVCLIIMFLGVILVEFTKDGDSKIGMYATIIIPVSFFCDNVRQKVQKNKSGIRFKELSQSKRCGLNCIN